MKWKNKIIFNIFLLGFFLFPNLIAQAVGLDTAGNLLKKAGKPGGFDITQRDPANIIGGVIAGLLSLIGVIFLLLMIYGGVRWMTARGESEVVEKSKGIIRNAVVGLIVVFLAYAIVWTVSTFLLK